MFTVPGPEMFVHSVLPERGQTGGKPLEEPYVGLNVSPEMFGGQVGQTLEQTGNQLAQHALQRQQLINEANVNDVYANQFSPAFRQLRENFLKLQGKDAEAQFPAFQQQANDLRQQFRDSLPNDMQRKMFDQQAMRRVQMELDGMSRYATRQTRAWQANTHKALIGDLISEAEANYNNSQRLENVQGRIDRELIDYGPEEGWSAEVFQGKRKAATDKLWKAVIRSQAVAGDTAGALSTYERQRDAGRISGQAQGRIENFLKPFDETMQAQKAYGTVTGGPVASQIAAKAGRQGADPNMALAVWSAEGGVTDPAAKNPQSTATGHF
jgi:hypothetical protein